VKPARNGEASHATTALTTLTLNKRERGSVALLSVTNAQRPQHQWLRHAHRIGIERRSRRQHIVVTALPGTSAVQRIMRLKRPSSRQASTVHALSSADEQP